MASSMNSALQLPLAERADVHKSCKSLETLVQALTEYGETVVAIVDLQKKLGKALRETAGMKISGINASNAMNTCATMFETLAEIDSKFSKYAGKECGEISADVRKWVKKLTKEEKAHDERLVNANARIKQAGHLYEKKAKKNHRDADEEHARYINLINTLGPEIQQEKHKHALLVTQRHATTTNRVAAGISRIADAEWMRSCESVRRFGPSIGTLGWWRALCEGGWTGAEPEASLPDEDGMYGESRGAMDDTVETIGLRHNLASSPRPEARREDGEVLDSGALDGRTTELAEPIPLNLRPGNSPRAYSGNFISDPPSYSTTGRPKEHYPMPLPVPFINGGSVTKTRHQSIQLDPPPQHYHPPESSPIPLNSSTDHIAYGPADADNFGSLSAFPSPPTYIPTPSPVIGNTPRRPRLPSLTSSQTLSLPQGGHGPPTKNSPAYLSPLQSPRELNESPVDQSAQSSRLDDVINSEIAAWRSQPASGSSNPDPSSRSGPGTDSSRGENAQDEYEFGVAQRGSDALYGPASDGRSPKAVTVNDAVRPKDASRGIERSDSVATNTTGGSIVAAMRSRYSYPVAAPTSSPRDLPRLPLKVADLATRYQPADAEQERIRPLSPRRRTTSPPVTEQLLLSIPVESGFGKPPVSVTENSPEERGDDGNQEAKWRRPRPARQLPPAASRPAALGASGEYERQLRTAEEGALREREEELRMRERELEEKARELEREKAGMLLAARDRNDSHDVQPYGGVEFPTSSSPHVQETASPSATVLRPPGGGKISRGGWMRRLSMPSVGHAFSLGSARAVTNTALVRVGGNQSSTHLGRR